MHTFSCRCSREMCELHSFEKGVQLLPSGSTTTARYAIQGFVEIFHCSKDSICVVLASNAERSPGGYSTSPTISTARDASDSKHATPWSKDYRSRRFLVRRKR